MVMQCIACGASDQQAADEPGSSCRLLSLLIFGSKELDHEAADCYNVLLVTRFCCWAVKKIMEQIWVAIIERLNGYELYIRGLSSQTVCSPHDILFYCFLNCMIVRNTEHEHRGCFTAMLNIDIRDPNAIFVLIQGIPTDRFSMKPQKYTVDTIKLWRANFYIGVTLGSTCSRACTKSEDSGIIRVCHYAHQQESVLLWTWFDVAE
jgi:hypothetical protein